MAPSAHWLVPDKPRRHHANQPAARLKCSCKTEDYMYSKLLRKQNRTLTLFSHVANPQVTLEQLQSVRLDGERRCCVRVRVQGFKFLPTRPVTAALRPHHGGPETMAAALDNARVSTGWAAAHSAASQKRLSALLSGERARIGVTFRFWNAPSGIRIHGTKSVVRGR